MPLFVVKLALEKEVAMTYLFYFTLVKKHILIYLRSEPYLTQDKATRNRHNFNLFLLYWMK